MTYTIPSDRELTTLLTRAQTIAIVGASSNPERPSFDVALRLQAAGYTIRPVNPRETEILGEPVYPSLAEVPRPVDIVVVFRKAEDTPPIADEAVRIGANAFWLQPGIVSEEAAARAKAGGLTVVMDRCIGVTHARLHIPRKAVE